MRQERQSRSARPHEPEIEKSIRLKLWRQVTCKESLTVTQHLLLNQRYRDTIGSLIDKSESESRICLIKVPYIQKSSRSHATRFIYSFCCERGGAIRGLNKVEAALHDGWKWTETKLWQQRLNRLEQIIHEKWAKLRLKICWER